MLEGTFQVQVPAGEEGGLYLEGRFIGGCFALQVWGAYIWRGDLSEGVLRYKFGGLIFGILRLLYQERIDESLIHCTLI